MTTAVDLLVHAVLKKTASRFADKANAGMDWIGRQHEKAPYVAPALGGAGVGYEASELSGGTGAVAAGALAGSALGTKRFWHQVRGGGYRPALQELEKGVGPGAKHWEPGTSGTFKSTDRVGGILGFGGRQVEVDPTDAASVVRAQKALEDAKGGRTNAALTGGILGKGLVVGAGFAGDKAPGAVGDIRKGVADARDTVGQLKQMTSGGEEVNVQAPSEGKFIKQETDDEGRTVIVYRDNDGQEQRITAPEPGVEPIVKLGPGGLIQGGRTYFRRASTAAAANQATRASANVIKEVNALAGNANKTMGTVNDVLPRLTTAAQQAGKGVSEIGDATSRAMDTADAFRQKIEDPKLAEGLHNVSTSIQRGSDAVSTGINRVGEFMQSDAAKLAGGGIAVLSLTYLASKLFGGNDRRRRD